MARNEQERRLAVSESEAARLYRGLLAGEPGARNDYARFLTIAIAIHARMDRALSSIHPPRAYAKRYRAMIAADRLRYGPDAERIAELYRQPSSPATDAQIKRLQDRTLIRDKRYKRLVIEEKIDGCGAVD